MKPITVEMRRSALIGLLRHPEDWPEGFEFYFDDCKRCAMGLASETLGMEPSDHIRGWINRASAFFGMSWVDAAQVFGAVGASYSRGRRGRITAEMIAEELEAVHRKMASSTLEHAVARDG